MIPLGIIASARPAMVEIDYHSALMALAPAVYFPMDDSVAPPANYGSVALASVSETTASDWPTFGASALGDGSTSMGFNGTSEGFNFPYSGSNALRYHNIGSLLILVKSSGGTGVGNLVVHNRAGAMSFFVDRDTGKLGYGANIIGDYYSVGTIGTGQVHLVGYNKADTALEFFIDGVPAGKVTLSAGDQNSTEDWYVGSSNLSAYRYWWQGQLAGFATFDKTLRHFDHYLLASKAGLGSPSALIDDFNRASLGSDWTVVNGTPSIVSNQLSLTSSSMVRHNTDRGSTDHWAEITCHYTSGPYDAAVFVRNNSVAGTFYQGRYDTVTGEYQIYRHSPSATKIVSFVQSSGGSPWTLRLEAEGDRLRLYGNGVLKAEAIDTTVTGVSTGVRSFNAGLVDDFATGDI